MRKTFFSIVVALLSLFMSNAYAQIGIINPPTKKHISREQALNKVKQYYAGKDVDYYGSGGYIAPIINTKDTIIYAVKNGMAPSSSIPGIITFDTNWIILVDEEPTKGWNHNCTIYTIPNTITTFGNTFDDFLIRPISIEHLDSFPSNKKFIPLEVKNIYGNKADILESLKCSEEALQTILDAEQYVDKRNPYYYLGKDNILLKNGRNGEASEAYT